MDENSGRSDTDRGLKYSGRKGSDKFQRHVSSPGSQVDSSSRFHFRPTRSTRPGQLGDVYNFPGKRKWNSNNGRKFGKLFLDHLDLALFVGYSIASSSSTIFYRGAKLTFTLIIFLRRWNYRRKIDLPSSLYSCNFCAIFQELQVIYIQDADVIMFDYLSSFYHRKCLVIP